MATENIIPELSWVCGFLFLIVIVVLIAACVCFKDHEKPHEYGTAGRLSITRDSPILQIQPRNGAIRTLSSRQSDLSSDDGSAKRNSWTVKDRALPEIPDSTVAPVGTNSVVNNGVHISNVAVIERVKAKSHNKAAAPKPPVSDSCKVFPLNGSALLASEGVSGVTVTITVNDKTQVLGNNATSSELLAKSHNPIVDSIPGTSNSMVILKKVEKVESTDSSTDSSGLTSNIYDTVADSTSDACNQNSAPSNPVCIQIGTSSTAHEEEISNSPSASLAVAGAVPSSDIPYMTPPLLHNAPSSPPELSGENISGERSEVPYTVISVREPLARVREITLRKQRTAIQQNSEESEDHYAMVPEEEQMYAEIGSGHDSGSSSITYAHIEPRDLPPVPPTVESLKSVAHAHSRQASTVSTSSFGSCLSSTGEPSSPPTVHSPSTLLYSTVEKNAKQRKTIHVAEGVSLVTTAEKRKKVEDLYAKVSKKRVELTINTSESDDYSAYQGIHGENTECFTPPPSPWASTTPPAPPPITGRIQASSLSVLLPGTSQHIRRHSADPNLHEIVTENRVFSGSNRSSLSMSNRDVEEPDYERIYNEENNSGDSCYEKIKEETGTNDNKSEIGYESVHSDIMPSERAYPGYEVVDDSLDPGYECVAQSNGENDPGYEPVRVSRNFDDSDSNSDYTVVKLDVTNEPDYEMVKHLGRSESDAADPGYEKIKKVPRTESNATDPGYERVKNNTENESHGYDKYQKSDSDTDPAYEIVHQGKPSSSNHIQRKSHRPATHNSSTVLFVSGTSEIHVSDSYHSQYNKETTSDSSESGATFL